MLEGGAVLAHFAASRTVFIPKSSTVDDDGLIVTSPDALRRSPCVTVTARSLPPRSASACKGTPSDVSTELRDAFEPDK